MEEALQPLVERLKKGNVKISLMTGAGISTGAGIPDFRSPKTGLYHNLARLNLPHPEAVFEINYFRENPHAFYTLADELYPGRFLPTKFHFLIRLLQDKKLLRRAYTQNIDALERLSGVLDDYIVEAHGSFARNHCIDCHKPMSIADLRKDMKDKSLKGIPTCRHCKGYVKPDIVFFGESLPRRFFDLWEEEIEEYDVAIVAGTSLTVFPFAMLPSEVSKDCLRVLINKDKCGTFETDPRDSDVVIQDECDKVAELLVDLLGWRDEFDQLVEEATKKHKENRLGLGLDETQALSEKLAKEIEQDIQANTEPRDEENDISDIVDEINELVISSESKPSKDSESNHDSEPEITEE
ncbi:Sir2 histone deacetylase Hst2 [Komagataella kurtzmanii]|nr:Sir2 histone deacetylase Hst2 [Komagataella kurtzmanii]